MIDDDDTNQDNEELFDEDSEELNRSIALQPLHWPTSKEELAPASAIDLKQEAKALARDHWDDIIPYWQDAQKGHHSQFGSFEATQFALAFKAKQLAETNGYSLVAKAPEHQIMLAMRYACKKVYGIRPQDVKAHAIAFDVDLKKRLAAPKQEDQS